eukprot:Gb_39340 [translate_table: standard]
MTFIQFITFRWERGVTVRNYFWAFLTVVWLAHDCHVHILTRRPACFKRPSRPIIDVLSKLLEIHHYHPSPWPLLGYLDDSRYRGFLGKVTTSLMTHCLLVVARLPVLGLCHLSGGYLPPSYYLLIEDHVSYPTDDNASQVSAYEWLAPTVLEGLHRATKSNLFSPWGTTMKGYQKQLASPGSWM